MTVRQTEPLQANVDDRAWHATRNKHLFAVTAGLGIVALFLMALVDKPVALFVHENVEGPAYFFWDTVTDIGKGAPYFILFGFTYVSARFMFLYTAPMAVARWYANLARTALFGLVSCAAAGIFINVIKFVVGRGRPRTLFREDEYGFDPFNSDWVYNSFPSGHSQTAFTVATVLALAIPRLTPYFFLMAGMIALSRVMIGMHYVSDIVFGSWLGFVIVLLINRRYFNDLDPLSFANYRQLTRKV